MRLIQKDKAKTPRAHAAHIQLFDTVEKKGKRTEKKGR
jgi:hypothetical protein